MGDMGEIYKDAKEIYTKIYDKRMSRVITYLENKKIPFKVISDRRIIIKDFIIYYPAKFWTVNNKTRKQGRGWNFLMWQLKQEE